MPLKQIAKTNDDSAGSGINSVLHVGMPKSGSSALQTALSLRPLLTGTVAPPAEYIALLPKGVVLSGSALSESAAISPSGYVVSARAAHIAKLDLMDMQKIRARIESITQNGSRLILSNEGWAREHQAFSQAEYLHRLGLKSTVVLYVRPQVQYCNSAWWQWGAWMRTSLPRWVDKQLHNLQWSRAVDGWREVPGVVNVRVRLMPTSIVSDFCELIGVQSPGETVSNPALPEPVLRLFQRHRELRKSAHDSNINFALARHLRLQGNTSPWVLDKQITGDIIEACRESNLRLREQLDASQRVQMTENPAWWDADYFAERTVQPWQPEPPSMEAVEALAVAALEALYELDTKNRALTERLLSQHTQLTPLAWVKSTTRRLISRKPKK